MVMRQTTSVVLPQFKLAFDVGRCPQRSCYQRTVLISHGHLDHIGGLHFHASTRSMLDMSGSVFIVPEGLRENTLKLLEIAGELNGHHFPYEVKTLKVGAELVLESKHVVRAFPTVHPVPSQGYVVYSRKRKLKEEYIGLPGNEIRDLRIAGVDITYTVETAEVAFTGDTCADFLDLETTAPALKAKLLIMEMTYLDDCKDQAGAKETGHMHLDDFIQNEDKFQVELCPKISVFATPTDPKIEYLSPKEEADTFQNILKSQTSGIESWVYVTCTQMVKHPTWNSNIVLTHFSPRYTRYDIVRILESRLPESLKSRCSPLLEGF